MRISRLAAALAIALASSGAFAADQSAGEQRDPTATSSQWYQAGERERYSEEQKAQLEREGFPQYAQ
jgi:hypothetical protein